MNFNEAETYLYSLGNEVEAMKLGLENITALLAALGEPQTNYKKVQVAGTNGKGSVCAFLDSICREAGIRTGLYTSPHLISITERIKIDGVDIAEDEFARLATRVRETAESLVAEGKLSYTPTFFEQVTAIALLAFAEHNVELAILETGLGGRYDAVTAAKAEIAAITRIDLDHQEYLGDTIEEIATEKAAIIHSGSRVVVGEQYPQALEVIRRRCKHQGIEPRFTSEIMEREGEPLPNIGDAEKIALVNPDGSVWAIRLGLRGKHQVDNARIAMMVAEVLNSDFPINLVQITGGIGRARHHGRLEYLLPNLLVDGAHNPAGAIALRQFLDEFEDRPITLIFGAMRDKAVIEIARILWPTAAKLILTKPATSRALTVEELAVAPPKSISRDKIESAATAEEAFGRAKEVTPPNGVIVVTGSLYLVGEISRLLKGAAI